MRELYHDALSKQSSILIGYGVGFPRLSFARTTAWISPHCQSFLHRPQRSIPSFCTPRHGAGIGYLFRRGAATGETCSVKDACFQ